MLQRPSCYWILFPPLIFCAMPPKPKKRGLFRRFVSFLGCRGSELAVDHHQDLHELASAGAGPSRSDHPSTHSVPDLLLPTGGSTLQCHESQPSIRPSRSENEIVNSSQSMALSISITQDPLQPPQPVPAPHSYDSPPASAAHGGTTSFFPGASGEFHVHAGDKSTDGMSIH